MPTCSHDRRKKIDALSLPRLIIETGTHARITQDCKGIAATPKVEAVARRHRRPSSAPSGEHLRRRTFIAGRVSGDREGVRNPCTLGPGAARSRVTQLPRASKGAPVRSRAWGSRYRDRGAERRAASGPMRTTAGRAIKRRARDEGTLEATSEWLSWAAEFARACDPLAQPERIAKRLSLDERGD